MVTRLLVIALVCFSVYGFPNPMYTSDRTLPIINNTIFADERFEGEIFENVDFFSNMELTPRNTDSPYRLPTTTKPLHYKILWTIDFEQSQPSQAGTVEIMLHATKSDVNEIVIHSDELTLTKVQLTRGTDTVLTTYEEDKSYQFLKVRLNSEYLAFNADNPVIYTLTIDFGAPLRDDMYGIYKNWYRNSPDENVRWMASTQFQSTAARWAFPCYDEPSFKATFDVTIRRQPTYKSWSCTRLKETKEVITGFEDDIYHTTPIMSTYLLAIIVADYDSIKVENTEGDLTYEVIARPGAIRNGQGDYAFTAGQALLAEMSSHTGIDFYAQHPHLKMTQAAIPDFGAGAMENWGLLTYREVYLMYDERETNSHFKQLIAYTVSHEIAHMWFGNLVTCDWWDNTWLNEGFARYYQYYLTYSVVDMGLNTRFITEQVHTSLLTDSSNSPQPLTNPGLNSNSAVGGMFSTISYNKGAAVIRMTEHLLGSAVHRQGLRNYLAARAYTTAEPIHLFESLQHVGIEAGVLSYGPQFSFIDYFKSWTEQRGHPVLNVHINHHTGYMSVSQRRFNINTGYSTVDTNYIVPLTFATASNPDFSDTKPTHILTTQTRIINRGTIGDEWVIFNKQQTGFYRVNYDPYTWDLITIALRNSDRMLIHEYNRAQIVNDLFQFARSGLMKYTRMLNILSFLGNETEYTPWVAAITGFNWLRQRLAGDTTIDTLNELNELIIRWASKVMSLLTYYPTAGESFMTSYFRYQLAPLMCNLGEPECIEAAKTQYQNLRLNNVPVPVDSRHWVYCNGLRYGNAQDFDFLWNKFMTSNVYTEKVLILQNIGCTKDAASLRKFMYAIVQDDYTIRRHDYSTAFSSAVNGNEENTEVAFAFIRDNLDLVANKFGGSVATPLSYVTARLRSQERIDEFISWANTNRIALGSAYNSVINGAESTRNSILWAENVQEDINNYLQNAPDPITTSTSAPTSTITDNLETTTITETPGTDGPETTDEVETSGTTVQQPIITEPVTPTFPTTPDVATKHDIALLLMIVTMIANIVL